MKECVEEHLIEVLNNHISCNTKLFELIRKERDFIIHNNLVELDSNNQEKIVIKAAIEQIEKERFLLMPKLQAAYGLNLGQQRMDDIIDGAPEEYKADFKEKQMTLKKLLKSIQVAQGANKQLIQQSLSFHERSFNLLFRLKNQQLGYSSNGEPTHSQKRLIDSIG